MIIKGFIWFVGLFFIVYGVAFAFLPLEMTQLVTGDSPGTPSGVTDLRSTYGGMTIAVGIVILLLSRQAATMTLSLLGIIIVLGAMAITRILGMLLDGNPNELMYFYLVLEIVGVALAFYARKNALNTSEA